ncbi:MAG: branched-chain amino acid ABC transporter ATP-binding protein/permease [Alphaproteobacteria bacterium]|nr:branched-chain amino acid ABC transporter ATP-binding protein/permease [Alphaproteobacteria bacterium]
MTGSATEKLALAAIFAIAVIAPFLGAYYLTFVFTMLIAYVVAQSWDWLHGEAGYVNLGHYIYFGIGAYVFSLGYINELPVVVCFAFAALFTAGVGAILSYPLFRLRGDYFAFATLALLPLFDLLAANLKGITKGTDGIPLPPKGVIVMGVDVKVFSYYVALAVCVAAFFLTIWLARNKFGFALKAIRNDEQAAEICGIRIFPVKLKTMALGATFAALAGACYPWAYRYIDPTTVFGLNVALIPIAMALLGGTGLLWGALIGTILLGTMQQMLLVQISGFQATIVGIVTLLIGRYMPGGLLRARIVRGTPGLGALGKEHHERLGVRPAVGAAGEALAIERRTIDPDRTILTCNGVTMAFGGNIAVNNVTLEVKEGEILGLIGPNGSGKTTLFNLISKIYEPVAGEIRFDGHLLNGLRRDTVSHVGIGRTYQIPRPFSDLTVQENIAIPLMFRGDGGLARDAALAEAIKFARFAGLEARLFDRADALNLQQRKALEFARALACRPKLLLVDEVASGLTPAEVRAFVDHIREMRDKYGVTVIWVEHIISALSQVVDRLVVLEQGSVIADGPLREVMADERVLRTYFGGSLKEHA